MTQRFFDRTRLGCGRYAYTLTELLVVISIIVILVAATLPIAKRIMDDSRTRDSARLLAGNFSMARTYAARNNRPFGLWLQLEQPIGLPGTLRQCRQVFLAEVQPPYAGDLQLGSGGYVEILPLGGPGGPPDFRGPWDLRYSNASMLPSLIEPNEFFRIRFDYRGHQYLGYRDNSATPRYLVYGLAGPDGQWGKAGIDDDGNMTTDDASEYLAGGSDDLQIAIPPHWIQGSVQAPVFHPFQILRWPRRVGSPIELIAGTCIDLEYCGMGQRGAAPASVPPWGAVANDGFKGNVGSSVVVLFSPKGEVDGVLIDGTAVEVKGTLHFLVGQVEKMNAAAVPGSYVPATSNLADVNSVWVSVGRLNGQAMTAENLPPPVDTGMTTVFPGEAAPPAGRREPLTPGLFVQYCRQAATARDQMGGK